MLALLASDKTNYFNILNRDIVGIITSYTKFRSKCGYNYCKFLTCYYLNNDIKIDYNPIIFIGYNLYREVSSINFTCYNKSKVLKGKRWQPLLNALKQNSTLLVYLFNSLEKHQKAIIDGLHAYIKDDKIIFNPSLNIVTESCFIPLPCINAIKCWQTAAALTRKN